MKMFVCGGQVVLKTVVITSSSELQVCTLAFIEFCPNKPHACAQISQWVGLEAYVLFMPFLNTIQVMKSYASSRSN